VLLGTGLHGQYGFSEIRKESVMVHKGSLMKRCMDDPKFKARLLANPLQVLKEEGYEPPHGWNIRFCEEQKEKTLTIYLPKAVNQDDKLKIEQLEKIVGGVEEGDRRRPY
jgi:hypothetical protein